MRRGEARVHKSILSLQGVRSAPRCNENDVVRRWAQRCATGGGVVARALLGALPSQSPGHRSSPAALAGCRCLARRALREVPKCLRVSYTRATIDRTPSPNSEILSKTFLLFIDVPSYLLSRSTSFTISS